MVDKSGNARLVDFGLAAIARNPHSLRSTLDEGHTTARWCAPEVLTGEECASKESDIFSFGMVIIEVGCDQFVLRQRPYPLMKVFTGKAPFAGSAAPTVVLGIMGGKRPERPNHASFTDNLWNLTRKCLEQAPSDRPKVEQVLEALRKSSAFLPFGCRTLDSRILAGEGLSELLSPHQHRRVAPSSGKRCPRIHLQRFGVGRVPVTYPLSHVRIEVGGMPPTKWMFGPRRRRKVT